MKIDELIEMLEKLKKKGYTKVKGLKTETSRHYPEKHFKFILRKEDNKDENS